MIVRIPKTTFDALAGYIRGPHSFLISQELEWYTDDKRRVLGVLAKDIIDEDFIGTVLGRDARGRFRGVTMTPFCETPDAARAHLKQDLDKWSKLPDAEFWQGDEEGKRLDFFTPVVPPVRLSSSFVRIATGEGFSPARALIESMMPYYEDVDGNFVEQFQSTGFDSRFWELYVFALMTEAGFVFDRSFHAPDFFCRIFAGDVFVEAMTANPTVNAAGLVVEPEVPREASRFKEYYQEYMPIKWGSTLTSKLKKEYWKLRHVAGKPIVFAIQDFHVPRAMTFLNHSLMPYLYGISFAALYDANEKLIVKATPRGPHKWGFKSIETGFFGLPGSENISAVIANPTATISKMNRMGYLAGLGSRDVTMVCVGTRHHHDDNSALPIPFKMLVNDPRYSEEWVEGVDVFHNPNANIPQDDSFLIGASHHFFENGDVRSLIPRFHPYQSETLIVSPKRASGALRLAGGRSLGSGVLSR